MLVCPCGPTAGMSLWAQNVSYLWLNHDNMRGKCSLCVRIWYLFVFVWLQDWKDHQHSCCQSAGGVAVLEEEPITAMDMDKVKWTTCRSIHLQLLQKQRLYKTSLLYVQSRTFNPEWSLVKFPVLEISFPSGFNYFAALLMKRCFCVCRQLWLNNISQTKSSCQTESCALNTDTLLNWIM